MSEQPLVSTHAYDTMACLPVSYGPSAANLLTLRFAKHTIFAQHQNRIKNHPRSEKEIRPGNTILQAGDVVYLYCDRDRYVITSIDGIWCYINSVVNSVRYHTK